MLVLSRRLNQEIRIGENIVVRVIGIKGNQVRLGIVAPAHVPILREEVVARDVSTVRSARSARSEQRSLKCAHC
jgi:carbon storage regulator